VNLSHRQIIHSQIYQWTNNICILWATFSYSCIISVLLHFNTFKHSGTIFLAFQNSAFDWTMYLGIPYDSQNKQWLLPCTAFTGCFIMETQCFLRYKLNIEILFRWTWCNTIQKHSLPISPSRAVHHFHKWGSGDSCRLILLLFMVYLKMLPAAQII
jgi:hypothetical protein